MKKISFIFICLIMMVVMVSCSKKRPTIKIGNVDTVYKNGSAYDLIILYDTSEQILISASNDCVNINGRLVSCLKEGEVTISVSYVKYPDINDSYVIKIIPEVLTLDAYLDSDEIYVGESVNLVINTNYPSGIIVNSKNNKVSIDANVITANSVGEEEIIVSLNNGEIIKRLDLKIMEIDNNTPVINLNGVEKDIKINWNSSFDPLEGVSAYDESEGDITNKIKVTNPVDVTTYGEYKVIYEVSDKAGHVATLERNVEVYWGYSTKFIGHGGSYYGVFNSEEAFLYAVQVLKYQALECDLSMTSDGVFVLCHDATFGGYTVSSTPYSTLKDVVQTSTRNGGLPSTNGELKTDGVYQSKICTLDRYLDICKEYKATAIIELKGCAGISQNDQSNMSKLMKAIEDKDMLDQVIFLGSAYNCLIWTRNNGYSNVRCQYLVNGCANQEIYDRCVQNDLDLSLNVTYGETPDLEWIKKYQAAGCEISTWTFTQYVDYSEVQKWLDFGVDYLTCDWHTMSKLDFSKVSLNNEYTVKFEDYDGTLLKTVKVKEGKSAFAPVVKDRLGYEFVGWDKSSDNITKDEVLKACYEPVKYKITYDENLYVNTTEGIKYITRSDCVMPDVNEYTILDEVIIPNPTTTLTFAGWYTNKECSGNKVEKINIGSIGDITLYAKWEGLTYNEYTSNIEYVLDGGLNNELNQTTYIEGVKHNLYAPTKVGYDFIGWTLTENSNEFIDYISERNTGDVKLYANYQVHTYKISYELNGGSWNVNPVISGNNVGELNSTANKDYFVGYQTNIYLFTVENNQKPVYSAKVFLKNISGNYYEIISYLKSGEKGYPDEYDLCLCVSDGNGSYYSKLLSIAKEAGIGGIVLVDGNISTGQAKITFYKRSDVSGLDVQDLIETYTILDLPIVLPNPKKSGLTFVGWSYTSDGAVTFTEIPADTTGDLVLYAIYK